MRVRGQGLDNALALFLGALRQTLQCVGLCPLRAIKDVRAELQTAYCCRGRGTVRLRVH
jgi:hypothetical protein